MYWILAHQGNWDEAIMFAIPIVIAVIVIKYTEKRGARKRNSLDATESDPEREG